MIVKEEKKVINYKFQEKGNGAETRRMKGEKFGGARVC